MWLTLLLFSLITLVQTKEFEFGHCLYSRSSSQYQQQILIYEDTNGHHHGCTLVIKDPEWKLNYIWNDVRLVYTGDLKYKGGAPIHGDRVLLHLDFF